MMIRNAMACALGGLMLGAVGTPVSAAPLPNVGAVQAPASTAAEQVAYYGRGCWRSHGRLYCRRYVRRYYPYAYYDDGWGPGYGYYGYGPSIGFAFGGGGWGGGRGWGGGHGGHMGGHGGHGHH